MYYNRKGQPIDMMEWGTLCNDLDYKVLARTDLPDGKWVSTVWLGLDHSFGGGAPLIFETMVFPSVGEWMELDCERYTFEEDAMKGHEEMVKKWSEVA